MVFVLLTITLLYGGFIYFFDYSIESPDFQLVETLSSNVEIRQYDSYYQAYVSYDSINQNKAFSKLFNFISGSNKISEDLNMTTPVKLDMTAPVKLDMTAPVKLDMTSPVKIDMTSPVKLDMTAPVKLDMTAPVKLDMTAPVKVDANMEVFNGMAFVMPNNFNPQIVPNDPDIQIQKIESKKVASIKFSGLMKQKNIDEKYNQLKLILDEKGYKYEEGYVYAGYNGPYVLPFLRRNEVWVNILE